MTNKTLRRVASWVASAGLLALVVLPAALAVPAYAQTTVDPTSLLSTVGSSSGLQTQKSLPEMIGVIIKQVLTILGIILVVIIIFAGFKWMTAQGNSEQVDEAKTMIKNAVIGLVLMLAAYAITNFVMDAILKGTGIRT